MRIVRYMHHGRPVCAQEDLIGKHREYCLCFQGCTFFHPGRPKNCPIAQKLFEFDVKYGCVTPMWECPVYEAKH